MPRQLRVRRVRRAWVPLRACTCRAGASKHSSREALDDLPEDAARALRERRRASSRTRRRRNSVPRLAEATIAASVSTKASRAPTGASTRRSCPIGSRLFRLPLAAACADEDELSTQIHVTLVHEFAHHFGIDDDRLDELGWA